MAKDGSRHAIITVDVETGRIISITDENGKKPIKVDPRDIDKIYQTTDGFKYVGTILHAQLSPGCVYFMMGGWWFKICL